MKSYSLFAAIAALLCCTAVMAQPPQSTSRDPKTVRVADLKFLDGRWEGDVDNNKIEQICSTTDPAVMACLFRLMSAKGTEILEFYTLRDTPDGVEERVRFFSSARLDEESGDGLTMKLTSFSPDQIVFENARPGVSPKRSTVFMKGPNAFTSRIEHVDAQGKPAIIEAHWHRP